MPLGSIAIVLAGVAGCAAVLTRAGATPVDVVPTRRRHRVRRRGAAPARLGPVHRSAARPPTTSRATPPTRGRRLSLVTLGLPRRAACSAAWRARCSPGCVLGGGRPGGVRPAHASRTPLRRCRRRCNPPASPCRRSSRRNADFYRIDTALSVPQLSRTDWRLRIHGMVDREVTYRFDDLRPVRSRREGRDADVRVQSGRRRPHLERQVDGLPGSGPVGARPVFTPTPTWCCRRRSTGSPRAPPSRRSPTVATRCWRSA